MTHLQREQKALETRLEKIKKIEKAEPGKTEIRSFMGRKLHDTPSKPSLPRVSDSQIHNITGPERSGKIGKRARKL
ncbi:MAG TPA: hypothetical protein VFE98_02000 [Candidatus Bathyarchaeia archaeon]|nr:hypothetical protein [Candidatus Bathyarchaeia archaeon]